MTVTELQLPSAPVARRRFSRSLRRRHAAPAIDVRDVGELPPDPALLLAIATPEAPALDDAAANALLVRVLGFACAATLAFDVLLVVTSA